MTFPRILVCALISITLAPMTANAQWLMVTRGNPNNSGVILVDAQNGAVLNLTWINGPSSVFAFVRSAIQVGEQVWISDMTRNLIHRYDVNFVTNPPTATAASPINLPAESLPKGMTLYHGRVYVVCSASQGIRVYDPSGALIGQFEQGNFDINAWGITGYRDELLLGDFTADAIRRYDLNHNFLGLFHDSNGSTGIDNPHQIARRFPSFEILAAGDQAPGGLYIYDGHGQQILSRLPSGTTGFQGVYPLSNGDILCSHASSVYIYHVQTDTFERILLGPGGPFISPLNVFAPGCGNGILEPGEACDDGNLLNGDGCDAVCQIGGLCGNGVLEPGEICDDGNLIDGDGCEQDCTTGDVITVCGNGILEVGEACDDGNLLNGDGCDQTCSIEAVCGNGIIEPGEQCDDGNLIGGDGCDSSCDYEIACGNSRIEVGEQCDDGNGIDGDGCDTSCHVENLHPELCITTESEELTAPPEIVSTSIAGQGYGEPFNMDGGRALTGALAATHLGLENAGAALIYELQDGHWQHSATLHADDPGAGDQFGQSSALGGDVAVVGATGANAPGASALGAFYVFRKGQEGWEQEAKIVPAPQDYLPLQDASYPSVPNGLAVSGDVILVGSDGYWFGRGTFEDIPFSGAVWSYRHTGEAWELEQFIMAPDASTNDRFGKTVDMDGDVAVIAGGTAAYVYRRVNGVWVHEKKLVSPSPGPVGLHSFGHSVAISGDTVVVSDPNWSATPPTMVTGAAWVFRRIGGDWVEEAMLRPFDPFFPYFGSSVDVDGNDIIIGAQLHDLGATNAGAAYVFRRIGGAWVETARVGSSTPRPNDQFGRCVSIHGGWASVSSDQRYEGVGSVRNGGALLFNLATEDCNGNGVADACEISERDCNQNGRPDDCDIALGISADCQPDGIPDECQLGAASTDVVSDGGFEQGTPNPSWIEASTVFGTPICNVAVCGNGDGSFGPRSGAYFAWFGGVAAAETASLEQVVVIPAGSAALEFYLRIPSGSSSPQDFLRVTVDGSEVFFIPGTAPGYILQYQLIHIDLTSFADGGAHALRIESAITGVPFGTSFLVDDVALVVQFPPINDTNGNGIPDECDIEGCLTIPGDVNGDSIVNGLDIRGFTDCCLAGGTPVGSCLCADLDHSNSVDASDLDEFVNALLGQ